MNQDRPQQPGKEPAVPPLSAEPGMAPSPFFAMPIPAPTGGEVIVPQQQPPVVNEQQPWPPPAQQAELVADQRVGQAPDPQQPPQGQGLADQHQAQLQRLCRHLRATDRCPGRCVLSRARQDRWLRGFPDMR